MSHKSTPNFSLLTQMAAAAYNKPDDPETLKEEAARKEWEAKVIRLPWAQLRVAAEGFPQFKANRLANDQNRRA